MAAFDSHIPPSTSSYLYYKEFIIGLIKVGVVQNKADLLQKHHIRLLFALLVLYCFKVSGL